MSSEMTGALVTCLAALATMLTALAAYLRSRSMGKEVHQIARNQNGLLTALLAAARQEGYRAGQQEGRAMRSRASDIVPPGQASQDVEGGDEEQDVSDR